MLERYLYPATDAELIDELITPTRMRLDPLRGVYRGKIEGIGTIEVEPEEFLAAPYWPRKDPEYWRLR